MIECLYSARHGAEGKWFSLVPVDLWAGQPVAATRVERRCGRLPVSAIVPAALWPTLLLLLAVAPAVLGAPPGGDVTVPQAAAGVLDLRAWRWSETPVISLDGEWEFYWGKLLVPADFTGAIASTASAAPAAGPSAYIPVPRRWNGFEIHGQPLPGDGYATYRLVVLLPDDPPVMAVKMYSAATAYRMWIDGRLAASNGEVATTREEGTAQAAPRLVAFEPSGNRVEIVIQVSNFHHWRGGLWRSILFGTAEGVMQLTERSAAVNAFFLGATFIVSIYHCALWLGHRNYRMFLYFGLFSFALAVRTLLLGEVLLTRLVPSFSYAFHLRMEYLPVMLGVPAMVAFARELFPDEFSDRFVRWSAVSGALAAAFMLLTPSWIMSRSLIVYQVLVLFPVLGRTLYGLVLAVVRRRPAAGSWLVGGGLAIAVGFNDFLFYRHVLPTADLGLVGLGCLVLVQSIQLGRQFAGTLKRQERLSEEKQQLVAELWEYVRALRLSRRLATEREEQLRRRIAEELHGPVQTRLLHAWFQLGKAREALPREDAAAAQIIEQARSEIEQVREGDIRELSHLLHPAVVQVGLVPALKSLVARFRDHFAVELDTAPEVVALDGAQDNRIPEAVRLAVYRVVDEALANVVRHGGARKVRVTLSLAGSMPRTAGVDRAPHGGEPQAEPGEEKCLWVAVVDDGKGLPPGVRYGRGAVDRAPAPAGSRGLGLQLIEGRIGDLGGAWSLSSVPGGGARLDVWIPL